MIACRGTLALILTIVALLLVAGCAGNERANQTSVQNSFDSIQITPTPTLCDTNDNTTYWISINPITDISQGNDIVIAGTTNLPEGTRLQARIILWDFYPHCRACFDATIHALVTVRKGESCINRFSWQLDTTNIPSVKSCTSSGGVNTWDRCHYLRYGIQFVFPGNISVQDTIIFNLTENTELQAVQSDNVLKTISKSTSFKIQSIDNVKQAEYQTIYGIVDKPGPGTLFSIRAAGNDETCYENCPGEIIGGLMHLKGSVSSDFTSFAFRFDTSDFKPGSYVADMMIINSNKTARTMFNVTN